MDEGAHAQRREIYLELDSGLDSSVRDLKWQRKKHVLDLFFGAAVCALVRVGRSFLTRTFGDETISGAGLSGLFDVAKRANNGGTGGCCAAAAPRGIGDDGTCFTGASLFFLRRKPAILGGGQKRRWK